MDSLKKITLSAVIILHCATIISCHDGSYINEGEKDHIVVEGWIKEGDYPVVLLTTSVAVSDNATAIGSLEDHVINWGRVAVSDGQQEVVLTGMYDKNYYPPYKYTTTDIKGVAGKTYTLDVTYASYHATATTTIPTTVTLDSITQEKVSGLDTLNALTADFVDPPGKNYYCLFHKIGLEEQQFRKCNLGVFDDATLGGDDTRPRKVRRPVYRTSAVTDPSTHSEYFTDGSQVCVELCTLDETSFNIWMDYQNSAALSDNFFVPYTRNIRSNINGGYGYWCGYGSSYKWIIVQKTSK